MTVRLTGLEVVGVLLALLGGACYLAEIVFYDRVDDAGVLQESFFLPLAVIFGFSGMTLMLIGVFRRVVAKTINKP